MTLEERRKKEEERINKRKITKTTRIASLASTV